MAKGYAPYLAEAKLSQWGAIRASLALSPTRHPYRLAVAAGTPQEAAERLAHHLAGEKTGRLAKGKAPARPPRLALVYSGNGPQWWGMGRELFAESAIFRHAIEEIDALFSAKAGWSLAEEMRRPEAESRIGLTEVAEPLLFAQQVALTIVLAAAGISASAVLGHSVGENRRRLGGRRPDLGAGDRRHLPSRPDAGCDSRLRAHGRAGRRRRRSGSGDGRHRRLAGDRGDQLGALGRHRGGRTRRVGEASRPADRRGQVRAHPAPELSLPHPGDGRDQGAATLAAGRF